MADTTLNRSRASFVADRATTSRSMSARRLPPDFLVIGAPKSGSTSLWNYLRRNPRIFMPELKEPAYFTNREVHGKGDAWYDALFAGAGPLQMRGEASTTYSRWPFREEPQVLDPRAEIVARNPDVRLVYVVRHPVERTYSHYGHHMRMGTFCTFEEALERNPVYVDCSRYDQQIARWREVLPDPRQLLVVLSDDLARIDETLLRRVQEHVGVEPVDLWSAGPIRANEKGARNLVARRLRNVEKRLGITALTRALPSGVRSGFRDMLLNSWLGARWRRAVETVPMRPETRARLLAELEPATRAVEAELGVALPQWRT